MDRFPSLNMPRQKQLPAGSPVNVAMESKVYASEYEDAQLVSIAPFHYLYVLDTNKNVLRVETGPKRLTLLDHEQVVEGPTKMITLGPLQYCRIQDPALRDKNGNPQLDEFGQV